MVSRSQSGKTPRTASLKITLEFSDAFQKAIERPLPRKMRERLIGFGHTVRIHFLLNGVALVFGGKQ